MDNRIDEKSKNQQQQQQPPIDQCKTREENAVVQRSC